MRQPMCTGRQTGEAVGGHKPDQWRQAVAYVNQHDTKPRVDAGEISISALYTDSTTIENPTPTLATNCEAMSAA